MKTLGSYYYRGRLCTTIQLSYHIGLKCFRRGKGGGGNKNYCKHRDMHFLYIEFDLLFVLTFL